MNEIVIIEYSVSKNNIMCLDRFGALKNNAYCWFQSPVDDSGIKIKISLRCFQS